MGKRRADVMLNFAKHLGFSWYYEDEILGLRLRMTLRHRPNATVTRSYEDRLVSQSGHYLELETQNSKLFHSFHRDHVGGTSLMKGQARRDRHQIVTFDNA
jgi:hypothetical protein